MSKRTQWWCTPYEAPAVRCARTRLVEAARNVVNGNGSYTELVDAAHDLDDAETQPKRVPQKGNTK